MSPRHQIFLHRGHHLPTSLYPQSIPPINYAAPTKSFPAARAAPNHALLLLSRALGSPAPAPILRHRAPASRRPTVVRARRRRRRFPPRRRPPAAAAGGPEIGKPLAPPSVPLDPVGGVTQRKFGKIARLIRCSHDCLSLACSAPLTTSQHATNLTHFVIRL